MLSRWFPAEVVGPPPQAKFLDLILYSREQIRKENEAMGEDSESVGVAAGNFSILSLSLPPSPSPLPQPCHSVLLFICFITFHVYGAA